ncbi:DNA adenine methylase [Brevundimonas vitis]|uniref:site-specific DNA-methyltransferase (adenine-specific) n=1 Tax=Brevundimonas vitisensis TaxID=2800818 RepID=A0ABX7BJK4_9CAUL|nr:DNA adenine methylase [Brevundimonas vitisensis]QQQ17735.1 DNA adenine methylase [Brevundimonas vitisensis]
MTESTPLRPIDPIRPPAAYQGGKRNLSRRLVERIGAIDHHTYVEPFVGMGGVFFRRDCRPKMEVINDLSGDVACLFRVLQEHYVPFTEMLRFKLSSRSEFDRLMRQDPTTLTDLRRAARFLYLQTLAFGGKVTDRSIGVSHGQRARFDFTQIVPRLADIHERLAGVLIENLPYDRLIPRYDRPGVLFYIDPPYWGCEDDYGPGMFGPDDFERLSGLLQGLRGRFMLSLNDTPEVRAIFAWAAIEAVGVTYTLPGKGGVGAKELIIQTPA